jgi:hypothetical protein
MYTQYMVERGHTYGALQDTMDILHITKEQQHNTLEQFNIY